MKSSIEKAKCSDVPKGQKATFSSLSLSRGKQTRLLVIAGPTLGVICLTVSECPRCLFCNNNNNNTTNKIITLDEYL